MNDIDYREAESTIDFKEWIDEYIGRELESYEGTDVYGCDLAYKLTECPNIDGSVTYSTYWAKEFIKNHFDECAEYIEYERMNFGNMLHNPFDEPEAFQVCMLIWGVENRLSESKTVNDFWDDKFVLTKEIIDKIKGELDIR